MFQTFNENQYYLQSQLLRHGELDWLARNTYFGDQRNYLEMDIDDTFTPDDVWDTTTHSIDYSDADAMRMNPADVATAATWEANTQLPHGSAVQHGRQRRLPGGQRRHRSVARCLPGRMLLELRTGQRRCRQAIRGLVRLDQPHLRHAVHGRGLRDPELHRGGAEREHQLWPTRRSAGPMVLEASA